MTARSGGADTGDLSTIWYEWHLRKERTVKLTISYYPGEPTVRVAGRHYRLSGGNMFFGNVMGTGEVEFRQLDRTLFECLEPREALAVFKRELPHNERVQNIEE